MQLIGRLRVRAARSSRRKRKNSSRVHHICVRGRSVGDIGLGDCRSSCRLVMHRTAILRLAGLAESWDSSRMSASQCLTPIVPAEASLFRQSGFWILQLTGWLLINLLYFWDFIYGTTREPLGPGPEVVIATSSVMSIACSTMLAAAYLWMPRRWLTGARALPVVFGLSLLAVLPWTTAMDLAERVTPDSAGRIRLPEV